MSNFDWVSIIWEIAFATLAVGTAISLYRFDTMQILTSATRLTICLRLHLRHFCRRRHWNRNIFFVLPRSFPFHEVRAPFDFTSTSDEIIYEKKKKIIHGLYENDGYVHAAPSPFQNNFFMELHLGLDRKHFTDFTLCLVLCISITTLATAHFLISLVHVYCDLECRVRCMRSAHTHSLATKCLPIN